MSDSYTLRAWRIMLVVASASLAACGSFNSATTSLVSVVTPYRMDVVQGNFVSQEQVAALKPGISRSQVRDVLGTPLLTSIFHADRWDYVFIFQRQGLPSQLRKLAVFFKGDEFGHVETDPLPSEIEFVASLDSGRRSGRVPVLELSEESLKELPAPPRKAEPTPLPPLPASYPPLEPTGP